MSQKVGFLFPGQGSQYVGMTRDILEVSGFARRVFAAVNEVMGMDLKELCVNGPLDELKKTQYTQPAIFTHSYILYSLLRDKGITPDGVAGHSLGEYSALVAAGAVSFEDAIKLVKMRGELMQHAGEKNPGTMAALIGMDPEKVKEVCELAVSAGVVTPANFNCPGQIVISGAVDAVHEAMKIAKDKGCKIVKELVVSGAFHSPLMEDAMEGLTTALDNTTINDIELPVYPNAKAQAVTSAAEIRELLKKQLLSPVLWEDSMRNMIADGFNFFIEVGPGKVLQGLLKRINRDVENDGVDRLSDLDRFSL